MNCLLIAFKYSPHVHPRSRHSPKFPRFLSFPPCLLAHVDDRNVSWRYTSRHKKKHYNLARNSRGYERSLFIDLFVNDWHRSNDAYLFLGINLIRQQRETKSQFNYESHCLFRTFELTVLTRSNLKVRMYLLFSFLNYYNYYYFKLNFNIINIINFEYHS